MVELHWPDVIAGGALILTAAFSVVVNLSVLVVLMRHFRRYNSIYIFAIVNIIGNTAQSMLTLCYLGPSSLLQMEIASPEIKKLLSYFFLTLWYCDMILQIVMAFNRFMTVVFHQYPIFTRQRCWVIGFIVYGSCFALAYFSDYVIPCCTAYLHYAVFSYAYIETGTNYTNMYVDLPLNATSSLICSILYTWIFVYVHKNSQASRVQVLNNAKARRRKEVRYAVQFAGCSLLSFLTWVTFRIFPLIISPSVPQLYSFTVQCETWHCTANSLIFIIFNHEFKDRYFRRKLTSLTSKGSVVPSQSVVIVKPNS